MTIGLSVISLISRRLDKELPRKRGDNFAYLETTPTLSILKAGRHTQVEQRKQFQQKRLRHVMLSESCTFCVAHHHDSHAHAQHLVLTQQQHAQHLLNKTTTTIYSASSNKTTTTTTCSASSNKTRVQVSGFRALLAEVGCQAGQHEVLADTLAKVEIKIMKRMVILRMIMMIALIGS